MCKNRAIVIFLAAGGICLLLPFVDFSRGNRSVERVAQEDADAKPKISLFFLTAEPPIFDFGEVEAVTHEGMVYLVNTSDEIIVIKDVIVDCTCSDVDFSKHDISPGEKVSLTFQIDMSEKSGDTKNSFIVFYRKKHGDYIATMVVSSIAKVLPKAE